LTNYTGLTMFVHDTKQCLWTWVQLPPSPPDQSVDFFEGTRYILLRYEKGFYIQEVYNKSFNCSANFPITTIE